MKREYRNAGLCTHHKAHSLLPFAAVVDYFRSGAARTRTCQDYRF